MNTQERMLKNFVNKYGIEGLRKMCSMFIAQESNATIAKEFDVTRQRVHQWQKTFTVQEVNLRDFVENRISSDI
jgi:hypothetical protein